MSAEKEIQSDQIPSDYPWVQKLSERDANTWEILYEKVYYWVRTDIRRRSIWLPTEMVMEYTNDCAQNAIERISSRLNLYVGTGPFLGWCRVITRNVVADWLRTNRRTRLYEQVGLDEIAPRLSASLDDIEQEIELKDIFQEIEAFMESYLSDRERTILYATESTTDLAKAYKTTKNNIYQIRFRTLARLRRHLEDKGYTIEYLKNLGVL